MGSSIRRQKILQMAGELAALEAEEKLFLQDKATEAVTRDDTRTLSEPAQNPDADKLPMTTEDMGYQPQVKAGETYPPLEPTGQLHDGTLSGPAVNPDAVPDAPKKPRGRPKGATSKVGRDVSEPAKVELKE